MKTNNSLKRFQSKDQSVRSSFKLTENTKELVYELADKFGSVKAVFESIGNDNIFKELLKKANWKQKINQTERLSVVIPQHTLLMLNSESKRLKIQRDLLIEILLNEFQKNLEENNITVKQKVDTALKHISSLEKSMKTINTELKKLLPCDKAYDKDYALSAIQDIYSDLLLSFVKSFHESLKLYLKKNIPIDIPCEVVNAIKSYERYVEGIRNEEGGK